MRITSTGHKNTVVSFATLWQKIRCDHSLIFSVVKFGRNQKEKKLKKLDFWYHQRTVLDIPSSTGKLAGVRVVGWCGGWLGGCVCMSRGCTLRWRTLSLLLSPRHFFPKISRQLDSRQEASEHCHQMELASSGQQKHKEKQLWNVTIQSINWSWIPGLCPLGRNPAMDRLSELPYPDLNLLKNWEILVEPLEKCWNDEMKTAMKKIMKINEIFWDCRVWCSEWVWKTFVWKMDQKSRGYGDMDWKNPGFEPEGIGK